MRGFLPIVVLAVGMAAAPVGIAQETAVPDSTIHALLDALENGDLGDGTTCTTTVW